MVGVFNRSSHEFTRTTEKTAIQAKNHIEQLVETPYVLIVTAQTENKPKEKPPEPTATIVNKYADDVPLTLVELAKAMRRSRWTIYRWKTEGYRFEFGRLTTLGHLKNWLRQQALKKSGTDKDTEVQDAVLARLK
jgi:hypothetical protein